MSLQDAFEARRAFTLGLTGWSVVSIAVGALLILLGKKQPFWYAVGWQCAIWGAIDLVFALAGMRNALTGAPGTAEQYAGLRRALMLSVTRLNWVWVGGSLAVLAWGAAARSPALLGHGAGALVQAAFLFVYDRAFVSALDDALAQDA